MLTRCLLIVRCSFDRIAVVDSVKMWLTKASWTAPQKHVSVVDIIAIGDYRSEG